MSDEIASNNEHPQNDSSMGATSQINTEIDVERWIRARKNRRRKSR